MRPRPRPRPPRRLWLLPHGSAADTNAGAGSYWPDGSIRLRWQRASWAHSHFHSNDVHPSASASASTSISVSAPAVAVNVTVADDISGERPAEPAGVQLRHHAALACTGELTRAAGRVLAGNGNDNDNDNGGGGGDSDDDEGIPIGERPYAAANLVHVHAPGGECPLFAADWQAALNLQLAEPGAHSLLAAGYGVAE